jgi:hypothetical protein
VWSDVLVQESEAVELGDGTLVIIRPIRLDDAPRLPGYRPPRQCTRDAAYPAQWSADRE